MSNLLPLLFAPIAGQVFQCLEEANIVTHVRKMRALPVALPSALNTAPDVPEGNASTTPPFRDSR